MVPDSERVPACGAKRGWVCIAVSAPGRVHNCRHGSQWALQEVASHVSTVSAVRYEGASRRERGFLLRALVDVWDNRCYWCLTSGDQGEFEIDHLVPPGKRGEGIKAYGLPKNFDVQSPANLAPICAAGSRCNQRKNERILEEVGNRLVATALVTAGRLAPTVERKVRSLRSSRGLGLAIDKVLAAELDPSTKRLIKDNGRALIQRVRAVDPVLLEDAPTVFGHFPAHDVHIGDLPGCGPEDLGEVVVELDGAGRGARAILEDVCGVDLGELVDEVLRNLYPLIDDMVTEEGPSGDLWQAFELMGFRGASVTELRARRNGGLIEVAIRGRSWSQHTANVDAMDNDGQLYSSGSCDIAVEGEFTASTSVDLVAGWDREVEVDTDGLALKRFDNYDEDAAF